MAKNTDFNILFQKVTTQTNLKDFSIVTGYNMYVQQIQNVCNTQKGEHPNHDFGCNLFDYLFNNQSNKHLLEVSVASSIEASIPSLNNVIATVSYMDGTVIRFNINFYIRTGLKNQQANCTIEVNI